MATPSKKPTPKVGMKATPKAITKPTPKNTAPKVGYGKDGFKPSAKPSNSPMSKKLTGEAAAEAVRKSTTPKGVKEFEKGASRALDKKYPGLYKKSK